MNIVKQKRIKRTLGAFQDDRTSPKAIIRHKQHKPGLKKTVSAEAETVMEGRRKTGGVLGGLGLIINNTFVFRWLLLALISNNNFFFSVAFFSPRAP